MTLRLIASMKYRNWSVEVSILIRDIKVITFNYIYVKTGGVAPESVIMELLKFKCLPCLYYDLKACPVNESLISR